MAGEVPEGLAYGALFWLSIGLAAFLISWLARARETRARRKKRDSGLTSDASRLRSRMTRLAKPTLLLTPTSSPGASKLGGDPDLPIGTAWPEVRGRPRAFLAQIDLGTFRPHVHLDWLPAAGLLYAFLDLEGQGFADQVQVLLQQQDDTREERLPPARNLRLPERHVAFAQYTSTPSLDWLGVDLTEVDLDEAELDELADLPDEPFGDEIQHRIGGYPSEIQGGRMAVTCELIRRNLPEDAEVTPAILRASKAWRLLFQIDSDPALNMNWGDGGRLYVFVREQDAKAGDFSRTITLSQTH